MSRLFSILAVVVAGACVDPVSGAADGHAEPPVREQAREPSRMVPFGLEGGTESGCDANGKHTIGEACDNGAEIGCTEIGTGPGSTCRVDDGWRCVPPIVVGDPSKCGPNCGDGFVFSAQGEACDDGNQLSGDGCSKEPGFPPACLIEVGWTCTTNTEHTSVCTPTACGDGISVGTEACDDGAGNSDVRPAAGTARSLDAATLSRTATTTSSKTRSATTAR